jgi:hypothetical protein
MFSKHTTHLDTNYPQKDILGLQQYLLKESWKELQEKQT